MIAAGELAEGIARGFQVHGKSYLAVRVEGALWVYLNVCPHLGVPLEWEPDQFMDRDTDLIRCFTHGALFEPAGGLCVHGPCRGERLRAVAFSIDDEGLIQVPPPAPTPPPV